MEDESTDRAHLEELGNIIRMFRKDRGLSQEQLGFLAGLDRTYIGGIERGERNISFLKIVAIAESFGVSLSELFTGYGKSNE